MLNFGFSYVAFIFLIMLFVPNIIWSKNKPQNYENYVKNENRFLLLLERIGEVLVCCISLIFTDFNLREINIWSIWLALAIVFMACYECFWITYFRSEKTMKDFYASYLGMPVAGATYPVLAFLCLGIYGSNIFLIVATIILGIGHIGIHINHRNEVERPEKKNLIVRIIKGIITFIFILICIVSSIIIGIKNYHYTKNHVSGKNGVEEETFLEINGQKQYCLIRGEDTSNPVIIWVHGGPASPDTMSIYYLSNYLKDDYTFIAYNQRGSGRSYYKNVDIDRNNDTATFEQLVDDLDILVDYARNRFNQDKVIVVGHSFGTMVGCAYSVEHPDKVLKYIGVGQMGAAGSDKVASADALSIAKAAGDDTKEFEAAIKNYEENPTVENMLVVRSYADKYHKPKYERNYIIDAICSPYLGVDDAWWFAKQLNFKKFEACNSILFDYISNYDIYNFGTKYEVPIAFISGSCDWVTPVACAKQYYDDIDAPDKTFKLIEGWGHTVPQENPKGFAEVLDEVIRN